MFAEDNDVFSRIFFDIFCFPFAKERLFETILVFIISLILFFIPVLGPMLSFAIIVSYALKICRIKAMLAQDDNKSTFFYFFKQLFVLQLCLIPLFIILYFGLGICMYVFYFKAMLYMLLAIAVGIDYFLKILIILSLVLDNIVLFLFSGFLIDLAISKKTNIKESFNTFKHHSCEFLRCQIPFIIISFLIIAYILPNTSLALRNFHNLLFLNLSIISLLFFAKYYAILLCFSFLAYVLPVKKLENIEQKECSNENE